jgi:ubiquinone/menaquinone biosynthesis C-methylase UbiE
MTVRTEKQNESSEILKTAKARGEKPDYGHVAIKYFIYIGMIGGLLSLIGIIGLYLEGAFGEILWLMCLPLGAACIWMAGAYVPLYYAMMRERALPNHWKEVLDEEHIESDVCALDIGCGTGRATIDVAKALRQARVIGIDIFHGASGNSPDQGRKNAYLEGVGDRVEIRHGNALEIPYPDDTFNLVTSSSVMHDIHSDMDKKKALEEVYRVLKPGGTFIALELFRDVRMWSMMLFFSLVWKTERFWRTLFSTSNFKQVKMKKYTKILNYGIIVARKE